MIVGMEGTPGSSRDSTTLTTCHATLDDSRYLIGRDWIGQECVSKMRNFGSRL
jgi:hypothetical protein